MDHVRKRNLGRLLIVTIFGLTSHLGFCNTEGEVTVASPSAYWGGYLEPDIVVSLFTLIAAFLFGIITVLQARNGRRKQCSFDLLTTARQNSRLESAHSTIAMLHSNPNIDISKYAEADVELEDHEKNHPTDIRYVLNHFEHMAAGIHTGVLDEHTLQRCQHSTVIKLQRRCMPFIEAVRADARSDSPYTELTTLARRWQDNPPNGKEAKGKCPQWKFWDH